MGASCTTTGCPGSCRYASISQWKNGICRRRATYLFAKSSVPTISILSHFRGQIEETEPRRKKFLVATIDRNKMMLVETMKLREITNCRAKTRSAACSRSVAKQARKAARIPVYSQNNSATDDNL